MKIGSLASHASGPSVEACHFLLSRFDERYGLQRDTSDTWIVQRVGTTCFVLCGGANWFTSLWRSSSGAVFATESAGRVHYNPDPEPRRTPFRMLDAPGVLGGAWGLDDDHVFVWGHRVGGARDETILYRFDGSRFVEMPAPRGNVIGMGGSRPDLLYAVGEGGLIARWDGETWHDIPSPTQTVLSAITVVSDDEMYAVGAGRRLLRGSTEGWSEVLVAPTPLFGVAEFLGDVWVGASETGLCKLAGDRLEVVKPNIKAERLEAREGLLISSPAVVAGSRDGVGFKGVPIQTFAAEMTEPLGWKPVER